MTETHPFDPTTERWHHEIPSPVGPLLIVAGTEAIVGLYHEEHSPAPDRASLGRRLEEDGPRRRDAPPTPEARAPAAPSRTAELLLQADRELGEYFAGSRHTFHLPIELQGTVFQQQVWAAVSAIPYAQTRSYRDIATLLGNPRMGRAIGAAVRSNPVSVIVPGHRVVGSTGAVVGYAAGTATKTALLELELAHRAPSGPVSVPDAYR
ncbi:methylated-DNA--[protein]-cysteine S-methyltransferase [Arthrobacter sp. L77]|uniref:methylated-DNA--[protein]-cysteine S-methyltransferase n=1 Tax=Arthrobacter sp. L77 TaxID=1496689 RepID=UPI00068E95C9|nr:methylated-DNA--[protein]-cysteine S-methyltransferase [Arthrobacter sp. L77]